MRHSIKRFISIILSAVIITLISPQAYSVNEVYSGKCGDNLYWSFTVASAQLVITGNGEMYDFENQTDAPWYDLRKYVSEIILPQGITHIGDNAFYYFLFASAPVFPLSLTSIGSKAFIHCESMKDIVLPKNLKVIGSRAFEGCRELTGIEIPASVETIGASSFSSCKKLNYVTIANGVSEIGDGAYAGTAISEISLPASVTSIGASAFADCTNLSKVTVSDQVTSVGAMAFKSTPWLNAQPVGCIYVGKALYRYKASGNDEINLSVKIKDGTVSISSDAFALIPGLISVEIPDSVTSIGGMAFRNCESLREVTLSKNVSEIGDYAFGYKTDYTSSPVPIKVKDFTINGSSCAAFEYCEEFDITYNCTHSLIEQEEIISCDEGGFIYDVCEYCDYRVKSGTIPPGHHFSDEFTEDIAPGCNTFGEKSRHCAYCDARCDITVIEEYRHTPEKDWNIIQPATPEKSGTADRKCILCGKIAETVNYKYYPIGDVNRDGKVKPNDVTFLKRVLSEKLSITDEGRIYFDVNRDGKVKSNDVTFLKRIISGKIVLD